MVIGGANIPDFKLLEATLDAVVIERLQPSQSAPQHLCLDKGYVKGLALEEAVQSRNSISHIRRISEEKFDEVGEKRYPARRWVVERTRWAGSRSAEPS